MLFSGQNLSVGHYIFFFIGVLVVKLCNDPHPKTPVKYYYPELLFSEGVFLR